MCQINAMTAFAAIAAGTCNANIETRIGSRAPSLGVTRLAVEHTVGECCCLRFGRRSVICW